MDTEAVSISACSATIIKRDREQIAVEEPGFISVS